MRAIIVAAGMGRRLSPYTDDRPKCLVEVNGRSILARQIDAYRAAGIDDLAVVRGYMKERIQVPGARHFENDTYRENNILVSLFHAEEAMDEVYKEFRFDLCRTCQKLFIKAPLGPPRPA